MEDLVSRSDERTLTEADYVSLTHLLGDGVAASPDAEAVQRAMGRSRRVASSSGATGLVTMYAQVFLVIRAEGQLVRLTLCYPHDADPARGWISVLSPLGASLIGVRSGQVVTWRAFGRVQTANIVAVLAPLPRKDGGDA